MQLILKSIVDFVAENCFKYSVVAFNRYSSRYFLFFFLDSAHCVIKLASIHCFMIHSDGHLDEFKR